MKRFRRWLTMERSMRECSIDLRHVDQVRCPKLAVPSKAPANRLVNDLTKLGIDLNQPGVKGAVANLQKAVSGTIAKRAAEQ